ncbi:MbtH family NRPS accessory protein [Burkholderia ambifaria]|uniref:MbtH family NRPS accessory protein n=1 Tax=Burkholderia ambifaria TaxID=152480 RepID=UPI003D311D8A
MRVTRGINYRNERDMEVDTPKNAAAFKVVVNHEEQYAIWPDEWPVPEEWQAPGASGARTSVSNGSAPTGPAGAHCVCAPRCRPDCLRAGARCVTPRESEGKKAPCLSMIA